MSDKAKNIRVAKNTLMLYTRQIVIMLISLYTVRVIFNALGEKDYGIYTVIGSVVTMFSIFSGAMASASQRYFSFSLGKNDMSGLKKVFSLSLIIYIAVIGIAVFLMETVGLWFVTNRMVIPQGRETAALWTYQATILSMCCTLLTTPYMALIIAHEQMNIYARISVLEAGLRLITAWIVAIKLGDSLIVYAILSAISMMVVTSCYKIYCKRKYKESKFEFYWNLDLFKEIFSFTGWNMFGSAVGTFKIQAVNIVLNQYFSGIVVAARGIATQVNSAVISFSQSFGTAIKPVIVKEYAAGNNEQVNNIVYSASKATFMLMYIFVLPLCFEMDYVLHLWLGIVPEEAVAFTILTIIDALIDSVSYPLMSAAQATGRIKLYQAVVGGIQLLNPLVALIAMHAGAPAEMAFVIAVFLTIFSTAARLILLKRMMAFSITQYFKYTIFPLLAVVGITVWCPILTVCNMQQSFFRLVLTTALCLTAEVLAFCFVGLNSKEKKLIYWEIKRRLKVND